MNLKPYPEYKDSGIQWIGEIPKGWEVRKLKTISKIVLGKMLTNDDKGNYLLKPYLRAQNIFWENVDVSDIKEMWFSPSEIKIYRLSRNDLLVSEGGEVGRTAIWSEETDECYIQNSVHKVTISPEHNPRYFLYVFETFGLLGYFESIVNRVTIGHLTREKVKEVNCIVPPLSDQTTIASFLDKKNARIGALIEKDKKLIALLKEKRTALINHAVTKGLDKNAKMKKANLLICDEKPENWQIIRMKFVIRLSRGVDLSNVDFEEGNIPVYGSNGIIGYHNEATSKGPGVTVGRSGSVGEVNFVNEERYWAHNTSLYLQENYGNNVRYIYYLLSILDLKHLAAGSAVGTLNRNYIHDLFVSLPSKQEQQKIVKYLNKATSKIDKTIQVIENKINLLEEYKKSLIHHVVTGKVDVRKSEV